MFNYKILQLEHKFEKFINWTLNSYNFCIDGKTNLEVSSHNFSQA